MSIKVAELFADLSLRATEFSKGLASAVSDAGRAGADMSVAFGDRPQRAIEETEKAVKRMTWNVRGYIKDTSRVITGILISQGFYKLLNAIEDATSAVINFSSQMEQAAISFDILLGNQDKANRFLETLKSFAATTPFTVQGAQEASQRLLAMGFAAENLIPIMRTLTDASAVFGGTKEQMDRIVLALGQMKTNGFIAGQELRQLAEAGIPAYKILQEELGLTTEQLQKIGKLKIPGDLGVAAMLKGMEKRYAGASERIAKTFNGLMSTVKDDLLIISEQVFKGPYQALKGFVGGMVESLENMRKRLKGGGLGGLFESLVPKDLQQTVRMIIASLRTLGAGISLLWKVIQPVIAILGEGFLRALGILLPPLTALIKGIAYLINAAWNAGPALRILTIAITGLLVANYAARAMLFLFNATRLMAIAAAVGRAVVFLGNAIKYLYAMMTKNPVTAVITLVAAALISFALSSDKASAYIDKLLQRLYALMGIQTGGILEPAFMQDTADATDEFNKSLTDAYKDLRNVGKEAEAAGKKVKDKFVASFDELYQIPEKLDDVDDEFGKLNTGLDNIPQIKLPTIPTGSQPNIGGGNGGDWPPLLPAKKNPTEPPQLPPPDTGAVATALESIESMIASMRQKLQPAYAAVSEWVTEVSKVCVGAGEAVVNFFTVSVPQGFNAFTVSLDGLEATVSTRVTNIANRLGQIGVTLGELVTQGANSLGQFGANIVTFTVESALSFANWSVDAANSVGQWAVNTGNAITEWSGNTAGNFASWIETNLSNLGQWSSNAAEVVANWATATSTNIYEWAVNTSGNIGSWIESTLFNIGTWATNSAQTVANWVNGTASGMASWVNNVASNVAAFANSAADSISSWAGSTWDTMSAWISGTASGVYSWAKSTLSTIVSWAQSAWSTISGLASAAGKSVGSYASQVGSGISNVGASIGQWYDRNKGWVVPVAVTAAVVGAGIAIVASGGTAAPALALLALEQGGIVDREQYVKIGEKNRREAVIPMENDTYMRPFSNAVASDLAQILGTSLSGGSEQKDDRPILYVGTLIASDQSLRELNRKMKVIDLQEQTRLGGATT